MSFENYYNELKESKNNMSYWLPKVEECGIEIPLTKIFNVPQNVVYQFGCIDDRSKQQEAFETIYNWVKEEVIPNLPFELTSLCFIKNGAFSNKFDFKTCASAGNTLDITKSLIDINYLSMLYDTGGNTEFAIRQRIHYNYATTPCIYNGMPLQNEYRIFYDFDNKKPLYIVNYWDWDYCYESISREYTDKIIYEHTYPKLKEHYENNKDKVMQFVHEHMQNVQGLDGIWSVDILEDMDNEYWLIDMAEGHRSAYWNPDKVKECTE